MVSNPLLSEFSNASRTEVSHSSKPLSPLIPLYRQWRQDPVRLFRPCVRYESALPPTCPRGPITVMCSDSYPLLLGTDSQSRRRFGLGWYISVTMEYACQHSSFSFSTLESRITRIANKSYTPLERTLLLFHLLVDGVNGLGASLDVEVQSRIFQLFLYRSDESGYILVA